MENSKMAILIDYINYFAESKSFAGMREYTQHGRTDCLLHSIAVAHFSLAAAAVFNIRVNKKSLVKGALLHDYFLYDWHNPGPSHKFHGFTHPETALANAKREWELNDMEADIIKKHMFPLIPALPRYKESVLVCIADKVCSSAEILYLPPSREVKQIYDNLLEKIK